MYSIAQLFKQEPNAIREVVLSILAVLVMTGVIDASAEVVAGVGLVVSGVLGLFYVRPLSASKDALNKLEESTES